jgi:hypothetical protein
MQIKIPGGQLLHCTRGSSFIVLGSTRGRTKNLHRNLEIPESSTGGLGAGKKGRSRLGVQGLFFWPFFYGLIS